MFPSANDVATCTSCCSRPKSKPRHSDGVCTPSLLVIPHLMRTLAGGRTRYRLLCLGDHCKPEKTANQGEFSWNHPSLYLSAPAVSNRRRVARPRLRPSTKHTRDAAGKRGCTGLSMTWRAK
jgi:hypothetical protein